VQSNFLKFKAVYKWTARGIIPVFLFTQLFIACPAAYAADQNGITVTGTPVNVQADTNSLLITSSSGTSTNRQNFITLNFEGTDIRTVLLYLADREDAMHYTGSAKTSGQSNSNHSSGKPKKERKVSTGSVPDFAFKGEGVKLSSVIANSAGDKAGLKAGDVITAIDGEKTENLKKYSDKLKQYQPSDSVTLTVLRNGKEEKIKLTLGER